MVLISEDEYNRMKVSTSNHEKLISSIKGNISGGQINNIEISDGGKVVIKPNEVSASSKKPARGKKRVSHEGDFIINHDDASPSSPNPSIPDNLPPSHDLSPPHSQPHSPPNSPPHSPPGSPGDSPAASASRPPSPLPPAPPSAPSSAPPTPTENFDTSFSMDEAGPSGNNFHDSIVQQEKETQAFFPTFSSATQTDLPLSLNKSIPSTVDAGHQISLDQPKPSVAHQQIQVNPTGTNFGHQVSFDARKPNLKHRQTQFDTKMTPRNSIQTQANFDKEINHRKPNLTNRQTQFDVHMTPQNTIQTQVNFDEKESVSSKPVPKSASNIALQTDMQQSFEEKATQYEKTVSTLKREARDALSNYEKEMNNADLTSDSKRDKLSQLKVIADKAVDKYEEAAKDISQGRVRARSRSPLSTIRRKPSLNTLKQQDIAAMSKGVALPDSDSEDSNYPNTHDLVSSTNTHVSSSGNDFSREAKEILSEVTRHKLANINGRDLTVKKRQAAIPDVSKVVFPDSHAREAVAAEPSPISSRQHKSKSLNSQLDSVFDHVVEEIPREAMDIISEATRNKVSDINERENADNYDMMEALTEAKMDQITGSNNIVSVQNDPVHYMSDLKGNAKHRKKKAKSKRLSKPYSKRIPKVTHNAKPNVIKMRNNISKRSKQLKIHPAKRVAKRSRDDSDEKEAIETSKKLKVNQDKKNLKRPAPAMIGRAKDDHEKKLAAKKAMVVLT